MLSYRHFPFLFYCNSLTSGRPYTRILQRVNTGSWTWLSVLLEISYSLPNLPLRGEENSHFCCRTYAWAAGRRGRFTPEHQGKITNIINIALPIVFQYCSQFYPSEPTVLDQLWPVLSQQSRWKMRLLEGSDRGNSKEGKKGWWPEQMRENVGGLGRRMRLRGSAWLPLLQMLFMNLYTTLHLIHNPPKGMGTVAQGWETREWDNNNNNKD